MPRTQSIPQREVKEKSERSSQASARQSSPDQDSAAAYHRHGKEPVSTRPACQPVVSRRR